jgi:uncharacterized protein YcbX
MLGEKLSASEVTERGLLGDRAYAVVDSADGKAATAKNPRKWPKVALLTVVASSPESALSCAVAAPSAPGAASV